MPQDLNQNIKIAYNTLNMPVKADKGLGTKTEYMYDAAGRKLRTKTYEGGSLKMNTDYCGAFVYENNQLRYINIPEGRIAYYYSRIDEIQQSKIAQITVTKRFEYYLTDHLGNVRVMFTPNGTSTTVLQEDHYYPFGLQQSGMGYTNVALLNKYLFNGKEKQDQTGMYDYGFRQYDAVTGRWVCADKMAEMYVSSSPYAYVRNNPVNRVDVMGLWDDQDWGGPGDEEDPYMLAEVVCTPENWFDKFANSVADLFSKYSDEDYIEEPNEQYNSGTWEYMFWGDSNASENNLFEYSPQELHDNGYFVTSTAIQVVLLTLPVTEIFQGTVGLLRSAKAVETGVNEVNVANTGGKAVEDFVSVFHKGVLNEGVVSSSRSLSTGLEKASVEALERYGAVWEFKIPKTEFLQWKYNGLIESIMDLDKATGIINQEIRFSSSLAPKLNQYIVIP